MPRGALAALVGAEDKQSITRRIRERDIAEVRPAIVGEIIAATAAKFHLDPDTITEPCGLLYRNVVPHDDDWSKTLLAVPGKKNRWVAPGVRHGFVGGSGTLTVGGIRVPFKRGDVILHNPNVTHSVTSDSKLCASVVCTVPLKHTWNILSGIER